MEWKLPGMVRESTNGYLIRDWSNIISVKRENAEHILSIQQIFWENISKTFVLTDNHTSRWEYSDSLRIHYKTMSFFQKRIVNMKSNYAFMKLHWDITGNILDLWRLHKAL